MDKTVQLAADSATVTNNLRRRIAELEAELQEQVELADNALFVAKELEAIVTGTRDLIANMPNESDLQVWEVRGLLEQEKSDVNVLL